ncbi:hypothetical protein CDAR_369221, partial [Caerostris darwini]
LSKYNSLPFILRGLFLISTKQSTQQTFSFKRHLTPESIESTRSYRKANQLVMVEVILIPFPTNSPLPRPIICPHTKSETMTCPHKPESRYRDGHKTPEVRPIPLGGGQGGKSGEWTVAGIASSL